MGRDVERGARGLMRGFSLGTSAFARTAANFGGRFGYALASEGDAPHLSHRTQVTSNTSPCSENRYPSPLARSVCPPYGSRRSSLCVGFSRADFCSHGLGFADFTVSRICRFAWAAGWDRITPVVTSSEAEKTCANPFLFLASSPLQPLPVVCRPTGSAHLQVPQRALSSQTRLTTMCSPGPLWARLRAPIATTRAFVTNFIRLTGPHSARPFDRSQYSFPGGVRQGSFFVAKTIPTIMTESSKTTRATARVLC